jgi:hypothetical protein
MKIRVIDFHQASAPRAAPLPERELTRDIAIQAAAGLYDSGAFLEDLSRRVGYRTESQEPESGPLLRAYLTDEIAQVLTELGFRHRLVENPAPGAGPFLADRADLRPRRRGARLRRPVA